MTENKFTDAEVIKASSEISCDKIKAIYPHIVVSGDIDKPYYSIQWYDIEKKTMFDGYASYKLGLVKKWLQENFEVIDDDIDNFINRQKAEIENLSVEVNKKVAEIERLNNLCKEQNTEIKRQIEIKNRLLYNLKSVCKEKDEKAVKAEAIKEFAEVFKVKFAKERYRDNYVIDDEMLDNLVKEVVGDAE